MSILFSSFLSKELLSKVDYLSYFPVIMDKNTIKLLPSDHGAYYPLEFDSEKKILNGQLNFYNEILLKNYKEDNSLPAEKIKSENFVKKNNPKALIVNLLDNCYGHSLLKLLHLADAYKDFSSGYDIYAVTHSVLEHYIPNEKINIISVKLSFSEAQSCFSLDRGVLGILKKNYSEVYFLVLDTHKVYSDKESTADFFNFSQKNEKQEKKNIVFYYRRDFFRTWGGKKQGKYINEFFQCIRPYFNNEIDFTVLGEKDDFSFSKNILDERTASFGPDTDKRYNAVFKNSIITAGVHGSNMVLPCLLSQMTIHLTPVFKLKNLGEDLFNYPVSSIMGMLNHIYIPSNSVLMDDISPKNFAFMAVNFFQAHIEMEYKYYVMKHLTDNPASMDEYLKEKHGYFNYESARSFRKKTIKHLESPAWKKYHFLKLMGKIK